MTALAEYQENLVSARKEAGEMISKAKADAKAAGEELRRQNEEELAGMKYRAQRRYIRRQKRALSARLKELAGAVDSADALTDVQRRLLSRLPPGSM